MKILISWIVIAAVATIVAVSMGQSGAAYFFGGIALWPIVLLIVVIKLRAVQVQRSGRAQPDGLVAGIPFWFVGNGRIRLVDARIEGTMRRFGSLDAFRVFAASMSPEAEVSGKIPPSPRAQIMPGARRNIRAKTTLPG
jgi:hypothetical protein